MTACEARATGMAMSTPGYSPVMRLAHARSLFFATSLPETARRADNDLRTVFDALLQSRDGDIEALIDDLQDVLAEEGARAASKEPGPQPRSAAPRTPTAQKPVQAAEPESPPDLSTPEGRYDDAIDRSKARLLAHKKSVIGYGYYGPNYAQELLAEWQNALNEARRLYDLSGLASTASGNQLDDFVGLLERHDLEPSQVVESLTFYLAEPEQDRATSLDYLRLGFIQIWRSLEKTNTWKPGTETASSTPTPTNRRDLKPLTMREWNAILKSMKSVFTRASKTFTRDGRGFLDSVLLLVVGGQTWPLLSRRTDYTRTEKDQKSYIEWSKRGRWAKLAMQLRRYGGISEKRIQQFEEIARVAERYAAELDAERPYRGRKLATNRGRRRR
jgi:hypothetical protein